MATLSDLLAYCKQQARIEQRNYDSAKYWRADVNTRTQAIKLCFKEFGCRLRKGTEELIPGNYDRLTVLPDGSPDYTPGQYAPVEIYNYLHYYLRRTN